MKRLALILVLLAALSGLLGRQAQAASGVRFGIQDDGWIIYGPGKLGQRLDRIDALGVDVVRFTLRWDEIERARLVSPRSPFQRAAHRALRSRSSGIEARAGAVHAAQPVHW